MANENNRNAVSSLSSVLSSIENDHQVYRWFLMLISLPSVQQKLSVQNKTKEEYRSLKKIQISEIITYSILALMILTSYLIKQPLLMLGVGVALIFLVSLFRKNRRCVAAISKQFLLENMQPEQLESQTLFQTCEHFSKQYNTPSLVDIITFQDIIGRKALLGSIFFAPFIYPINYWQIWVVLLSVLLTTTAIVNTSIVLRKLK